MRARLFLAVWLLALWGAVAIIPYTLSTQTVALADLPVAPAVAIALGLVQSALLLALLTAAGLWLARKVGLDLPFLESWLYGTPVEERWQPVFGRAAILGIAAAAVTLSLELLFFMPALARSGLAFPESARAPVWQGFLASFYGGITEEVIMRLFFMSLLVWLGGLVFRTEAGRPAFGVFWTAIVLAAIVFGLGHLPATAALGMPLNTLIVSRAIVLNAIPGILFGWLYWRRGLESAMVAHFAADIVLVVILPLIMRPS